LLEQYEKIPANARPAWRIYPENLYRKGMQNRLNMRIYKV